MLKIHSRNGATFITPLTCTQLYIDLRILHHISSVVFYFCLIIVCYVSVFTPCYAFLFDSHPVNGLYMAENSFKKLPCDWQI